MELILANGSKVKVTLGEMSEFIREIPCLVPNPYWRYSELLTEEEVMRYLAGESNEEELRKIARYILIYTENLAFTAHLYDKSEGHDNGREFNMPAVERLREIYHRVTEDPRIAEELAGDVHEMESVCLEIGADPL